MYHTVNFEFTWWVYIQNLQYDILCHIVNFVFTPAQQFKIYNMTLCRTRYHVFEVDLLFARIVIEFSFVSYVMLFAILRYLLIENPILFKGMSVRMIVDRSFGKFYLSERLYIDYQFQKYQIEKYFGIYSLLFIENFVKIFHK